MNFCKKLRDIDIIDDYCEYIEGLTTIETCFNYNLKGGIMSGQLDPSDLVGMSFWIFLQLW